jgi:hypothetical protein
MVAAHLSRTKQLRSHGGDVDARLCRDAID